MGVDTECDLAVDAGDDERARAGVRRIRDRLLGEHLGLKPGEVAAALDRAGSMAALIDAREHEDRTLVKIELSATPSPEPSELLRAAVDPDEPVGFSPAVGQLIPSVEAATGGNPLRLWILPSCVLATALIVAWASGVFPQPELRTLQRAVAELPTSGEAVLTAIAAFVIGGVALIPLELLAIAAGMLLGFTAGGTVAFAGSITAAAIGYVAGRIIGPGRLSQWMSRASFTKGRQLGAQGVKGIALLRISSLTTAGATHLLCGAGRVPFGAYLTGTVIGLLPPVAALTWLGALQRRTLLEPSLWHGLASIGAALAVLFIALGIRAVLLIRQFTPAHAGQRRRAEFG
jgi:uncharacterized membrane protein YdjX (TVP38/TMEM64 family)